MRGERNMLHFLNLSYEQALSEVVFELRDWIQMLHSGAMMQEELSQPRVAQYNKQ